MTKPIRIQSLRSVVELRSRPRSGLWPTWREALDLIGLLKQVGLFVTLTSEMPSLRIERSRGGGFDPETNEVLDVQKVFAEVLVEKGESVESRVARLEKVLVEAGSPYSAAHLGLENEPFVQMDAHIRKVQVQIRLGPDTEASISAFSKTLADALAPLRAQGVAIEVSFPEVALQQVPATGS